MADLDKKRAHELKTMKRIIEIYCEGKHKSAKGILCQECEDLWLYAQQRVEACPHMEEKTFCSFCKTHCYKPTYRSQMREVMKFGGPKMFWENPKAVIMHMYYAWQGKNKIR